VQSVKFDGTQLNNDGSDKTFNDVATDGTIVGNVTAHYTFENISTHTGMITYTYTLTHDVLGPPPTGFTDGLPPQHHNSGQDTTRNLVVAARIQKVAGRIERASRRAGGILVID
jgi:hypothetical protein